MFDYSSVKSSVLMHQDNSNFIILVDFIKNLIDRWKNLVTSGKAIEMKNA